MALLVALNFSSRAFAVSNSSAQFTINPVYSNLQRGPKNSGYFDLNVKKAKQANVQVRISNLNANQKVRFLVKVGDAITTDAGTIEYSNFQPERHLVGGNLRVSQLVESPQQKLTIMAGQSKVVTIKFKIPKTDFSGTLAGGVYVERLSNAKTKGKGIITKNHFAMTLPILLTKHPEAKRIAKMKLNGVSVKKGPIITAKLSNVKPVIFGQLAIDARIMDAGGKKTILAKKVVGYQVAPKSAFDFLVSKNSKKLGPGKYLLDVAMQSGKRKWHFKSPFTVTASQAAPLTKRIKISNSMILWIVIAGLILLIIVLIMVILIQRKMMKLKK